MKRIFLGIPIPHAVGIDLMQIFDEQNPLLSHDRFRKLTLEQLHLTVHFFGSIEYKKLDFFQETLQSYLKTFPAFAANILRIARFPNSRSHLVAAHVETSQALVKLYHDVQSMVNETFITKISTITSDHLLSAHSNLKKTYRPHITICRIKGKDKVMINDCAVEKPFKITELNFYESKPSVAGSQYIILERLFFG